MFETHFLVWLLHKFMICHCLQLRKCQEAMGSRLPLPFCSLPPGHFMTYLYGTL